MIKAFLLGWSVLVVVMLNYSIYAKERTLRHGETVYLQLAPVDPRSLIQGDYMRLRYAIESEARSKISRDTPKRGYLVVQLDEQAVGHFLRFHGEGPLHSGEKLIRYHKDGQVHVVPDSFMFQEGFAEYFERAAYGVFKLDRHGRHVLAGLADENLQLIDP